jgi:hypothetical protein
MLQKVEVDLAQGMTADQINPQLSILEQIYYQLCKQYKDVKTC